jgi:CO/xanthine dehydrogenase Mo-binding subunit
MDDMGKAPHHLSGSLASNPRLDSWVTISNTGIVTLSPGKVEIGQGILTALALIAARELDVPLASIRFKPATTGISPNEGVTSGSLSVRDSGMAIRQVSAEVRQLFIEVAAARWGIEGDQVSVADGIISGPGNLKLSYGELADTLTLARDATGKAIPKAVEARSTSLQFDQRTDVAGRVFATRGYIQDLEPKDLMHGRVLRAPRPGAKLKSLDEHSLKKAVPDAIFYRDGNFIGILAPTEMKAEKALTHIARLATWEGGSILPDQANLGDWLQSQKVETELVEKLGQDAPTISKSRVTSDYIKPFLAHASIAISCAIATWSAKKLHVLSHTQGIYNLRADLALIFAMDPDHVTVEHAENAGCYGHNGADDVALDAALLARAVSGFPVRVRWSRADELTHSPFGAAMLVRLSADIESDGNITFWQHEIWSNGHTARPGRAKTPGLLAGFELERPFPRLEATDPPLASGGGAQRNAVPGYDFPNRLIVKNRIPHAPLRTSSMRSLGAIGNIFAIESFMDELAEKADIDPLQFRLRYLRDPRARAVLEHAAQMANWGKPHSENLGLGLAFARYKNNSGYCAVVAEVDVSAEPRATHLWIAADIGEVISPNGAKNQIEGGAIQAVSWTLKEELRFSRDEIYCKSWDDYPILRFSEVPKVDVALMDRPHDAPLGAGEISLGPTAAAIANAIHNCLGVRVREMPLTRDRIIAAMEG